jgi:hypothetical protein
VNEIAALPAAGENLRSSLTTGTECATSLSLPTCASVRVSHRDPHALSPISVTRYLRMTMLVPHHARLMVLLSFLPHR